MKMRDFITLVEGRIFEALDETARYNNQIAEFLTKEGIKFTQSDDRDRIFIDRTSMVQYAAGFEESESYKYVLELIKERLPDNLHIMWSGRTDDWLSPAIYERSFSR